MYGCLGGGVRERLAKPRVAERSADAVGDDQVLVASRTPRRACAALQESAEFVHHDHVATA